MAMSTTSIIFSGIVFMLLSTTIYAQASGYSSSKRKPSDLMVEACKNASIYIYIRAVPQEFCLSTLQSDSRSTEAKDLHDLVLIAVDITKSRITAASGTVKKMLQNAKKRTVAMRVLSFCVVDYEEMVSILNVSGPAGYCENDLDDMPKEVALLKENVELQMLLHMCANFLEPLV
ncbi:hypothetical protein VPH35_069970 [Triticum aestivum]